MRSAHLPWPSTCGRRKRRGFKSRMTLYVPQTSPHLSVLPIPRQRPTSDLYPGSLPRRRSQPQLQRGWRRRTQWWRSVSGRSRHTSPISRRCDGRLSPQSTDVHSALTPPTPHIYLILPAELPSPDHHAALPQYVAGKKEKARRGSVAKFFGFSKRSSSISAADIQPMIAPVKTVDRV